MLQDLGRMLRAVIHVERRSRRGRRVRDSTGGGYKLSLCDDDTLLLRRKFRLLVFFSF